MRLALLAESVRVCAERLAVSLAQRLVSRRLRSHLPTSVTVIASEAFDCTVTLHIPTLSVYHTVCDASVRLLINCINSAEQKTLWPQVAIKIKANRCMLCVVLLL